MPEIEVVQDDVGKPYSGLHIPLFIIISKQSKSKSTFIDRVREINESVVEHFQFNIHFVDKVQPNTIVPTKEIFDLFARNDFDYDTNNIAEILSHYNLYKKLSIMKEQFFIIIDEISVIDTQFESYIVSCIKQYSPTIHDILLLGYHESQEKTRNIFFPVNKENENKFSSSEHLSFSLYKHATLFVPNTLTITHCNTGYIISSSGVKKILDYISVNSVTHSFDKWNSNIKGLITVTITPHIVTTPNIILKSSFSPLQFDLIEKQLLDDWITYDCYDYPGYDAKYYKPDSLWKMIHISNSLNCIAFNSHGFHKHHVDVNNLKKMDKITLFVKKQPIHITVKDKLNRTWIYHPGYDIKDNDLFYDNTNNHNIDYMLNKACSNLSCISFNTLGFYKYNNSKSKMTYNDNFRANNHGLYILSTSVYEDDFFQSELISCISEKLSIDKENKIISCGIHRLLFNFTVEFLLLHKQSTLELICDEDQLRNIINITDKFSDEKDKIHIIDSKNTQDNIHILSELKWISENIKDKDTEDKDDEVNKDTRDIKDNNNLLNEPQYDLVILNVNNVNECRDIINIMKMIWKKNIHMKFVICSSRGLLTSVLDVLSVQIKKVIYSHADYDIVYLQYYDTIITLKQKVISGKKITYKIHPEMKSYNRNIIEYVLDPIPNTKLIYNSKINKSTVKELPSSVQQNDEFEVVDMDYINQQAELRMLSKLSEVNTMVKDKKKKDKIPDIYFTDFDIDIKEDCLKVIFTNQEEVKNKFDIIIGNKNCECISDSITVTYFKFFSTKYSRNITSKNAINELEMKIGFVPDMYSDEQGIDSTSDSLGDPDMNTYPSNINEHEDKHLQYENHYEVGKYNYKNKPHFCIYNYDKSPEHRTDLFNLISLYGKITSPGKSCNNDNNIIITNENRIDIYSKYKFVIIVEKELDNMNISGKIMDVLRAGSIPIVYSNDIILKYININRIIYVGHYSDRELLKYIKLLDENELAYNNLISQYWFPEQRRGTKSVKYTCNRHITKILK